MSEEKQTEISLLEMDFEDSPPCEVILRTTGEPCGKPAAVRVYSVCGSCGDRSRFFACAGHIDYILSGLANCAACTGPRGITTYC